MQKIGWTRKHKNFRRILFEGAFFRILFESTSLHASLQYISTCVLSFQNKPVPVLVDGESFSLSLHICPFHISLHASLQYISTCVPSIQNKPVPSSQKVCFCGMSQASLFRAITFDMCTQLVPKPTSIQRALINRKTDLKP